MGREELARDMNFQTVGQGTRALAQGIKPRLCLLYLLARTPDLSVAGAAFLEPYKAVMVRMNIPDMCFDLCPQGGHRTIECGVADIAKVVADIRREIKLRLGRVDCVLIAGDHRVDRVQLEVREILICRFIARACALFEIVEHLMAPAEEGDVLGRELLFQVLVIGR